MTILHKLIDLISGKEGDKQNIETPHYDKLYLRQYRQGIHSICDCVQDDGKFWIYPQDSIFWQSIYKGTNIKDMSIFVASIRNIYRPNEYELVLQTNIPLENIESLYSSITYRIIVLKKYKKEIKPMDEKQKILNDIEEAQHKLDEARKKLDEYNTGYKRWKPEVNEKYWYVDDCGTINYTCFMPQIEVDIIRFKNYNCFKTKDEAQQEADKIFVRRRLEDIARRLNRGRKLDWDDKTQNKYYLYCEGYSLLRQGYVNWSKRTDVYCLDKNFLDIAKREIGEDRLVKYIRGEG